MSTIFGFVVGYIVGARAGSEGIERLEQAVRDIRDSDEFRNFTALLKSHLVGTIDTVNERLKSDPGTLVGDVERLAGEARARLLGRDVD